MGPYLRGSSAASLAWISNCWSSRARMAGSKAGSYAAELSRSRRGPRPSVAAIAGPVGGEEDGQQPSQEAGFLRRGTWACTRGCGAPISFETDQSGGVLWTVPDQEKQENDKRWQIGRWLDSYVVVVMMQACTNGPWHCKVKVSLHGRLARQAQLSPS